MAKNIENATRGTQYNCDPQSLTLIWESADPRSGPRDLILSDWPQHSFVARAFDRRIKEPTDQSHVNGMITKLDGGGLIGVLENVIVRIVPCPKDMAKKLKIAEGEDLLIVTDGRSRTKEAREANKMLAAAGETKLAIRVPFDTRRMSDVTAEVIKGTANMHRKDPTPLEIAHYAASAIDAKVPRDQIQQELKLESWAAVENYSRLLDLSPNLQDLVDDRVIPIRAAVEIGKAHKLHEDQDKAAALISAEAAASPKGKVKGEKAKALASGETGKTAVKFPSAKRIATMMTGLEGAPGSLNSRECDRRDGAHAVLKWLYAGGSPETVPTFLADLVKAKPVKPVKPAKAEKKAKKPVKVIEDPIVTDVRDGLIKSRYPVRFALMLSLRQFRTEDRADTAFPDENCIDETWYARVHRQWLADFVKSAQATPGTEGTKSRLKFFEKWIERFKE